jgi:hypothetical protein
VSGRLIAAVALVGLVGCDRPLPPCGEHAPSAELTRGDDPDVDLVDGDGIVMVHGPQGGWHVEFGLRVVDPDPQIVFDLTVDAVDGRVVDNHYDLRLAAHDGCTGWRTALYGFLSVVEIRESRDETPPMLLGGEELVMRLEVSSSLGVSTDEVRFIAELDPRDVPSD